MESLDEKLGLYVSKLRERLPSMPTPRRGGLGLRVAVAATLTALYLSAPVYANPSSQDVEPNNACQPSVEFIPDESYDSSCKDTYQALVDICETNEDEGCYAYNVQILTEIEQGGEFVGLDDIVVDPDFFSVLDGCQPYTTTVNTEGGLPAGAKVVIRQHVTGDGLEDHPARQTFTIESHCSTAIGLSMFNATPTPGERYDNDSIRLASIGTLGLLAGVGIGVGSKRIYNRKKHND